MPTEFNPLPGLRRTACTLDIDPALLLYLITAIGRRWARHHPHAATGRPQSDFVDLLVGTLTYLREQTTFRRAAAHVGLAKTTLNDAFDTITAMLAEIGIAQPDGTLLHPDDQAGLRDLLAEMAAAAEVVLVDGVPTRCPRPGRSWAAQKPLYDSKHHCHAVNAQTLTTQQGDLIAVHGGWPGSVHEATQLRHSHFARALRASGVQVVTDAGYRAARADFGVLARRGKPRTPAPGDREIAPARAENERPHALLKAWRVMDRTRIRGLVKIHTMTQAVAVLVGLQTYGRRITDWPTTA